MGRSLTAPVTRWMVTWTYPGREGIEHTPCALQEGHTTFNDLTAMIAIRRGLNATQISIQKIERLPDEV